VPKLVNLGSMCIDHVYGVPNISASGETVASTSYQVFPGGKGLNQSLAAAKAGARVMHAGCLGEDGQWLAAELARAGVDTSMVRSVDGASGHAVIQVNPAGENAIVIAGGANRLITADDITATLGMLAAGDWLLLQNEINDVDVVMRRAAEASAQVALNLAPVDGREADYDFDQIDLLIVNEVEAAAAAGVAEPAAALETLTARYPRLQVVLTLGADGLRFGCGEVRAELEAFAVDAVDETAAGDAFVGYYMAALLEGRETDQALRIASAAGALAVTRAGAASSVPRRAEVLELAAV